MSNVLRDAVESGASTFSELVDQARTHIEELPPIARARRKHARRTWSPIVIVLLVAFVAAAAAKRHHQSPEDHLASA
jgi:hypothetical protein